MTRDFATATDADTAFLFSTLKSLLSTSPLGIVAFDKRGKVSMWNQSASELFKGNPQEVLGVPGKAGSETPRASAGAFFDRILSGETLVNHPVQRRLSSGEVLELVWSASPLHDPTGQVDGVLLLISDLTYPKKIEQAMQESELFSRAIVDALPQHIAILDEKGTILKVNQAWRDFARANSDHPEKLCEGINYLQACENAVGEEVTENEAEAYAAGIRAVISGTLLEFSLEYACRAPDAPPRWFNGKVRRFPGDGPVRVAISHEDVTELKQAEEAIQHLAQYDHLTQLPNRMLLKDRLGQVLVTARRDSLRAAVLFLDLDRFKLINDTLGHPCGDQLLREVAERLNECVRKSDTVARIGGDEFIIILPSLPHTEDVTLIAQKILASLAQPVELEGSEVFTSTSIGIAMYPNDADDVDSLIRCADMAMYRAKERGRNTYQFFSAEMNRQIEQRLSLETNLRHAIPRNELALFYQEQTDLTTGKLVGMEVLLRWQHPELGLLAPGDFIHMAEETGLILPIGEWVLENACSQNMAWRSSKLAPLRVSVNISGRQLQHYPLAETVKRILDKTRLPPHCLELEITENLLAGNPETTARTLKQLKGLGVLLAIDDFGTGFSSLRNLKQFPIDRLKIDHSFLPELGTNPDSTTIIKTIIGMAHNLGMKVIAEGVETTRQREFLMEYGCDEVQGYYFSRPVSIDEFSKLLRSL